MAVTITVGDTVFSLAQTAGPDRPELLRAAAEGARNAATRAAAQSSPKAGSTRERIVGKSAQMQQLFAKLDRLHTTSATVLITGENGTGKELIARTVHDESKRSGAPFVAVNCSAFNDNLLESEMFGHKKGAFTDARSDKAGLFEKADGGTLFLDEIGDMTPSLQVKLLRTLQDGHVLPVGATEGITVDVRIVAATNRDLAKMVEEGTFREDLFYRINVFTLEVPPLRERTEDIPALCFHFLAELGSKHGSTKKLKPAAIDRLMSHAWPGNVRELQNEIERAWIMTGSKEVIDADEVLVKQRISPSQSPPSTDTLVGRTLPEAVEAVERRLIALQLEEAKGNKSQAARALGISRRNLLRKMQAYGFA